MSKMIDQLARQRGLSNEDATYIYTFFTNQIIHKIPQFRVVINDVFENADKEILTEDLNKAIVSIQQQQWKEKFKHNIMPPQVDMIHSQGNGTIL